MEYNEISTILDESARTLVGILCKRIELCSEEEKRTGNRVLTPMFYKSIIKEHIYEQNRNLKALIYTLDNGNVRFNKESKE